MFRDDVFKNIMLMKLGEIKTLDSSHKNYAKFVEAVKFIIDAELDILNGFSLTFSNDYTKLYKEEFPPKPQQKIDARKKTRHFDTNFWENNTKP